MVATMLAAQIVGKAKLSNDGAANEMVTRVGRRIAAVTSLPDAQWEYRLIQDDKQVNAFALPGGKVAVYTGILPSPRTRTGSRPSWATRSATWWRATAASA